MKSVRQHFDTIADQYDHFKKRNWYYYENLKALYREFIPGNSRVLEIGCGTGNLISHLEASFAMGLDISPEMIRIAKRKHPDIRFEATTIEEFIPEVSFDYIFLADVIEHLQDLPGTMEVISRICAAKTRVIFTYANPLWEPLLLFWKAFP